MSEQLILITGATGHLGFRTLILALQAGYRARISIRRSEQADKLRATDSLKPYRDRVEFVVVPDITADGAFDVAVEGADGILHIASPIYDTSDLSSGVQDWQKLMYDPAVNGTTGILKSAVKSSSVKRVVVTSSVVALQQNPETGIAGPYDIKQLPDEQAMKSFTHAAFAYVASKVLSHHAGTDFMRDHPRAPFDLVRIMAGYIQGANELLTSADEIAKGSNEGTLLVALGQLQDRPKPASQIYLDDVARAHVAALDSSRVKGGQNITAVANHGEAFDWDEFVPVVKRLFPDEVASGVLNPKTGQQRMPARFDMSESLETLGFEFAGVESMVQSVVGQYLRLRKSE